MNTIDLLDKLNLPTKIGLEGSDALLNKKTIMDAYLSAASLQFNRPAIYPEPTLGWNMGIPSLNQLSFNMGKCPAVDLFKMMGSDVTSTTGHSEYSADSKAMVDLAKFQDLAPVGALVNNCSREILSNENMNFDNTYNEADSFTTLEADYKQEPKRASKGKGKKKVEVSDINETIAKERRRLLTKLDSCEDTRVVLHKREKNAKRNPKVSADNYRGSKYWGVSKNKSKWQVCFLCF